jgi:hypothetical protein
LWPSQESIRTPFLGHGLRDRAFNNGYAEAPLKKLSATCALTKGRIAANVRSSPLATNGSGSEWSDSRGLPTAFLWGLECFIETAVDKTLICGLTTGIYARGFIILTPVLAAVSLPQAVAMRADLAIAMEGLAVAAEAVGEALFAIAGADLLMAAAPQLVVGKALSELLLAAVVILPLARFHLCAWWWRCCYPWLGCCS